MKKPERFLRTSIKVNLKRNANCVITQIEHRHPGQLAFGQIHLGLIGGIAGIPNSILFDLVKVRI